MTATPSASAAIVLLKRTVGALGSLIVVPLSLVVAVCAAAIYLPFAGAWAIWDRVKAARWLGKNQHSLSRLPSAVKLNSSIGDYGSPDEELLIRETVFLLDEAVSWADWSLVVTTKRIRVKLDEGRNLTDLDAVFALKEIERIEYFVTEIDREIFCDHKRTAHSGLRNGRCKYLCFRLVPKNAKPIDFYRMPKQWSTDNLCKKCGQSAPPFSREIPVDHLWAALKASGIPIVEEPALADAFANSSLDS